MAQLQLLLEINHQVSDSIKNALESESETRFLPQKHFPGASTEMTGIAIGWEKIEEWSHFRK